jgi:hypothetical protein
MSYEADLFLNSANGMVWIGLLHRKRNAHAEFLGKGVCAENSKSLSHIFKTVGG